MPYGTLPLLEFGDIVMFQSLATYRFLAKQVVPELYPETNLEQLHCDTAADCLQDFYLRLDAALGEPIKKERELWVNKILNNMIPDFYNLLENQFLRDGRKFLAGDKVKYQN